MRTETLRKIKQPAHVDEMLESLAESLGVVPEDARARRWSELPTAMRQLVRDATAKGKSACYWVTPGQSAWLFIGEMSLDRSRERGTPVLQMKCYGESGLMLSGEWMRTAHGKWFRCND